MTLTVADGIIGQIIAKKRMYEMLNEFFAERPIDDIPSPDVDDYVQDRAISAEVAAELEWNPVARLAAEFECGLLSIIKQSKWENLTDPELPVLEHKRFTGPMGVVEFPSVESLEARIRGFEGATKMGCRYQVETDKGRFSDTVWLRNITGPGVHPIGLAEDFAKVVVLKKVAAAYGITEEEIFRKSRGK